MGHNRRRSLHAAVAMVSKLRLTACALALFLLQAAVVHRFSHRLLRPDLIYLAAAFLALEASWTGALGGAFALGLLRDLGSAGRLGTGALVLLVATAGMLLLRDRLVRESAWTDLLLAFAYVLACGLMSALATAASTPAADGPTLVAAALGQAAFTAALSPFLFAGLARAGLVRPA
jgi:rod shape-determining protein MreD